MAAAIRGLWPKGIAIFPLNKVVGMIDRINEWHENITPILVKWAHIAQVATSVLGCRSMERMETCC